MRCTSLQREAGQKPPPACHPSAGNDACAEPGRDSPPSHLLLPPGRTIRSSAFQAPNDAPQKSNWGIALAGHRASTNAGTNASMPVPRLNGAMMPTATVSQIMSSGTTNAPQNRSAPPKAASAPLSISRPIRPPDSIRLFPATASAISRS